MPSNLFRSLFASRSDRRANPVNLRRRIAVARAIEPLEPRAYFAGIGQGLVGDYYSDQAISNIALARTDPTINFAWTTSPGTGVPANKYSVRWTGNLLAVYSQTYTLYTSSAGGVRVWINGTKVIDNWTSHALVENKATIALKAGSYYPIQIDYREDTKGTMKFSWSSASTPKAVVPKSQLYQVGSAVMAGGWSEANVGQVTGAITGVGQANINVKATGTVPSAGGPIGGSNDDYHFAYRPFRGDAFLSAKVNPVTTAGAEEGLVIRPNLADNSAFAGITVSSAGLSFESRQSAAGAPRATAPIAIGSAVFVKLTRNGNTLSGYYSATGAADTWQLVGTTGIDLGTFPLLGLASGGGSTAAFTSSFSSIAITPVNELGGNLNNPSDRVQDLPFTDLVETTRGFYNLVGRLASNGILDFATTDADGWPTEDFSFKSVDNTEWNVPIETGTYKMSFTGPAGVSVAGSAGVTPTQTNFDPDTGVYLYDVVVASGALKLTLTFTNTGGTVKNIRLLQPGYDLATAPTFTNKYLNLLRTTGPSVLRFMDWTKANNDMEVNWSDRPKPSDATNARAVVPGDLQPGKGVAWEYVIQLANTLGKDVWINVGAHASDDYIHQLAILFRDNLRADLNIYVEDSNEVWNSSFEQATYNKTQAVQEVIANPNSVLNYDHKAVDSTKTGTNNPQADTWGDRRHARRTKQISDIFRAEFIAGGKDDPINKRVRAVLGGQVASLSRFDNTLAFLNTNYGAPKNYLWGIGVAPYFNLGATNTQANATVAQILTAFNAGVDIWVNNGTLSSAFTKANNLGLRMIGYEGGPDTYGAVNIANKRLASLDASMQTIIARYLTNWYNKGGDLFNYYTIGARSFNSPYGTWSITESLTNLTAPKIKGFQQIATGYPVSTGLHGVYA